MPCPVFASRHPLLEQLAPVAQAGERISRTEVFSSAKRNGQIFRKLAFLNEDFCRSNEVVTGV